MKKIISMLSMMVVCGLLSQKSVCAGLEAIQYCMGALGTDEDGNTICSSSMGENNSRVGGCVEANVGQPCTNLTDKQREAGSDYVCLKLGSYSCAARKCNTGYAMRVMFPEDGTLIQGESYKPEQLTGKAKALHGVCYEKDYFASFCNDKCDSSCKDEGGQCKPWYVDADVANGMLSPGYKLRIAGNKIYRLEGGEGFVSCYCDKPKENPRDVEKEKVCKNVKFKCPGVNNIKDNDSKLNLVFTDVLDGCEPGGKVDTKQLKEWLIKNAQEVAKQCGEKVKCTIPAEDIKKMVNDATITEEGVFQFKGTDEITSGWNCEKTESEDNEGVKDQTENDSGTGNNALQETSASASENSNEAEDDDEEELKDADVKNARKRIEDFFSKVDSNRSVWKNADDSFNATRLASDLTAGVVLGTVGGVVSGVLIKKSQVDKGFDVLNCTVGGQKVADWGDEFRVGLRR